ncbi:NAD(P)H-binding protein [Bacillus sp. NP157]|nr:NAD(P)H-binding protein [Bacillus sp. NP157]
MYAITGITGQVGGALADALLAAGKPFRAVVRDAARAERFFDRGAEVAVAALDDTPALTRAFEGAEAVFILLPPAFDPAVDFLTAADPVIDSIHAALLAAQPGRVVVLSTIGAQAAEPNLLSRLGRMENVLATLPMPVTFLRAGWFIENTQWDLDAARKHGVIDSFLAPLDRKIAMVATKDVGETAARLLGEPSEGVRIVELEGPQRTSPDDLAAALARVLGHDVKARIVPRDAWEARFRAEGMHNPTPRMRMVDGFNEGWIAFGAGTTKGTTSVDEAIGALVGRR